MDKKKGDLSKKIWDIYRKPEMIYYQKNDLTGM